VLGRHPDCAFLYVGDGPMRDEVVTAAESGGLGGRLKMLGLRDDVPDLLRAMDVFILTSLWEGLPRAVLQALASGVPVVAYDTAGIAEAVIEGVNGHLVSRGAIEQMAARIDGLLGDRERLAAMGRAAHELLQSSISEERMIEDLESLYDELLLPRL
jgi:glycosyltransferase involved in cell wall biosynthesis